MLFDETFLRQLERLSILARRAHAGQTQGERRSSKRGQSVEFADFRPYASGDDIRRIDWNAYARLERFFIKLFVEEEDLTVHLLIDTSQSMDWGDPPKLGYAVRLSAALGYIALASLDRVTVTALGRESYSNGGRAYLPPQRGKRQAMALFSFLESLAAGGRSEPGARLRAYAATNQPGPLLLFSDLMDEGWEEGLRALASRGFEISVAHILAPEELDPQISGDLKLLDSESGAGVEITADYDLLARYRAGLAAWQADLNRFCAARGMHYVPISTHQPYQELLFAWMRKYGVLK
jgi:uncharacterized protein (DUF58 family)